MSYEIKESNIDGKGVFAKAPIKKGELICEYYGKLMSWSNFTQIYGKYKYNSLNTYPMRRVWQIIVAKEEPYKSKNVINFINEDFENPNVILKAKCLYALRDIEVGEELFLRYPKDYNRTWLKIP